MNEHIIEVSTENAQQVLIEESMQRPVVVDFWATWCEPCKTLKPMLEKLANEYDGQFLLATVDCDEQQAISSQFGIRNLPTVMIIKDGQPIDGFSGEQTEPAIREILDKHLPKPWDLMHQQAQQQMAEGLYSEALPTLRQALDGSHQQTDITMSLIQCYLELNRCSEAQALLTEIKLADQNKLYEQLKAQLELKQQAAKTPEIQALEEKLNNNPDDLESAYQLAVQFNSHDQHREALELLYSVLQQDRDFQEGAARKSLLDIIKTLGNQDPLATEYQKKLFALLY